MVEFPYVPRPGQERLVKTVKQALENRGHIVIEAPTGMGKTVCLLVAALNATAAGKKILYLTRTNSQQRQVVIECRTLGATVACVQGRRVMCPIISQDREYRKGTPHELSLLCKEFVKQKKCSHYISVWAKADTILGWALEVKPTAEEFAARCFEEGVCAYEVMKELTAVAEVVTAPYVYFFNPYIRKSLITWLNTEIKDLIIIVDEAHNLPAFAREVLTPELSYRAVDLAIKEAVEMGDPEVAEALPVTVFLSVLKSAIRALANEYIEDEDGYVPPYGLVSHMLERFGGTTSTIEKIVNNLIVIGEIVRRKKLQDGRLPRSYIGNVGGFLDFWINCGEENIKLIKNRDNPTLYAYCLDISPLTEVLQQCAGSVHTSGTLSPLAEYKDIVNLPDNTVMDSYKSPFMEKNRKICYVEDVTTRYRDISKDSKILEKIATYIQDIWGSLKKNTLVFYPSFSVMKKITANLEHALDNENIIYEDRNDSQHEIIGKILRFKETRGAIFHAVAGGRISEGMDFPGKELEVVIVAGMPFPKPTAQQKALERFFDKKFGKGWEYAVRAPTIRKTLQCIGRLIRSETDRGVAVVLDKRARILSSYIPIEKTSDVLATMRQFFNSK